MINGISHQHVLSYNSNNLYLIFRYVKILCKYKKYQMKYLKNIKKHIRLKK